MISLLKGMPDCAQWLIELVRSRFSNARSILGPWKSLKGFFVWGTEIKYLIWILGTTFIHWLPKQPLLRTLYFSVCRPALSTNGGFGRWLLSKRIRQTTQFTLNDCKLAYLHVDHSDIEFIFVDSPAPLVSALFQALHLLPLLPRRTLLLLVSALHIFARNLVALTLDVSDALRHLPSLLLRPWSLPREPANVHGNQSMPSPRAPTSTSLRFGNLIKVGWYNQW
jgi:hypothetical protein